MSGYTCLYCEYWITLPIRKKDKEGNVRRRCKYRTRTVKPNSESCRYFRPGEVFYCNNNNERLAYLACVNRRRNSKDFRKFGECRRCRQFENDIQELVEDYWLNPKKVVEPEVKIKGRKIKRRQKEPKRIIKRREKPAKRTIKRRKPKKKRRIIRRRDA